VGGMGGGMVCGGGWCEGDGWGMVWGDGVGGWWRLPLLPHHTRLLLLPHHARLRLLHTIHDYCCCHTMHEYCCTPYLMLRLRCVSYTFPNGAGGVGVGVAGVNTELRLG
jgi:hypothetical protein